MRTTKVKATIVTPIVDAQPLGAQPETYRAQMHRILDEALDNEGLGWKRQAIAFLAGLATSCLVGYGVGHLTLYAITGALVLSNSAFVALIIFVIGVIASLYLGSKLSMFAYVNIMNKNIDAGFAKANNAVRGLFVRRQGVTT